MSSRNAATPGRARLLAASVLALALPRSACRREPAGGWDAWPWMDTEVFGSAAFRAARADSAAQRIVRLLVRNAGTDTLRAQWGSCSFGVRLYRDAALAGSPVWDDRGPPNGACTLIGYYRELAPGEEGELAAPHVPVDSLRRALRPGRYFLAVALRATERGPLRVVPAGPLELGR